MSMRRIFLSRLAKTGDKLTALAKGLAGESFDTEIYQPYGISANPKGGGESIVAEINGDPDNFIALPVDGDRTAENGETLVYYGKTEIVLAEKSIKMKVDGKFLNIENGKLITDLDDIIISGVSVVNHRHDPATGKPIPLP